MNYISFAKTVALVAIATAVINSALAYAGKLISMPPDTFGPYMYSSVIGLTIGGVVAAAVVYLAIRYFVADAAKANRYFVILSWVALIVSFYPDIAMPWSTDADQIGWTYGIILNLMLMHVVAALPVIYYFPRRSDM
jgi:hypothetical protein